MKKAKEYVKQLEGIENMDEAESNKLLFDLIKEFLKESQELTKKRGGSNKVFMGVLNELDNKWKSIASKVPTLNKDGFRNITIDEVPEIKNLMNW